MQPRSVLVTGASSGIGRATVETFAAAGWQVAATMRRPEDGVGLAALAGVRVFPLDVTRAESVDAAVAAAHAAFGRLDAVVNNAGYAVDVVFEAVSDDAIRRQFETNVFGLMRVTRAAIFYGLHRFLGPPCPGSRRERLRHRSSLTPAR